MIAWLLWLVSFLVLISTTTPGAGNSAYWAFLVPFLAGGAGVMLGTRLKR